MRLMNQKLKLYYVEKALRELTDENHGLTIHQISDYLRAHDISAERKTLYSDMECLQLLGLDIKVEKGRSNTYKLVSREFELPEVKLLIDAVQSSAFITERKSRALVKKLLGLVSAYDARRLEKQVFIANRNKTVNESIYYNVDELNNAIADGQKVSFLYSTYDLTKRRKLKNNGAPYVVSPYALCWDDENYYLVCRKEGQESLHHFRVDKISNVERLQDRAEPCPRGFDPAGYARSLFGMFGGEAVQATLRFDNSLIGVALDRFGPEIPIVIGDDSFTTTVVIAASPVFFGWILQLGGKAEVLGPPELREQLREHVSAAHALYEA